MKYIFLPTLIIAATIATCMTGCADHDIYRAEYKYKPLPSDVLPGATPAPQQDSSGLPPGPGAPSSAPAAPPIPQ